MYNCRQVLLQHLLVDCGSKLALPTDRLAARQDNINKYIYIYICICICICIHL